MTSTGAFESNLRRTAAGRGSCARAQLGRLLRLVLILQAERFPNARELADRCEVSRRTIYRDLDLLGDAGISVFYRPERQGYQIARGFFLPPNDLDESEVLALMVMALQCRRGDGLGLLRHAWSGAIKLAHGLPTEARERVQASTETFEAAGPSGDLGADREQVQEAILSSFTRLRQIRIWYRRPDELVEECTKFGVYRLTQHDKHWFMIGRSSLHRRVERVGVHRVRKAVPTDDPYTIPPRFNLERYLGQAWGVDRGPVRHRVRLRFSPNVAPEVSDQVWHRSQRRVPLPDGRVDLHFVLDGVEEVLGWVLGFGDQVEVLEPPELKRRVFQVALTLARRNRPTPAAANRRLVGG